MPISPPSLPRHPAAESPSSSFAWQAPASRRFPERTVCRIVRQVVAELIMLSSDRVFLRRDRRRMACHVRQISMYVCHVALSMPQPDIAAAFGRDRTTVGHACHVVEDRRDDPYFDDFVSAVERIVIAIFGNPEVSSHG